mmetsp:Transcript_1753/g.6249  ORF Transcript_1753/g.6249 Transcript_1753/m.6249 type:complete len:424 (+) Transcript_1753:190-1461(+)
MEMCTWSPAASSTAPAGWSICRRRGPWACATLLASCLAQSCAPATARSRHPHATAATLETSARRSATSCAPAGAPLLASQGPTMQSRLTNWPRQIAPCSSCASSSSTSRWSIAATAKVRQCATAACAKACVLTAASGQGGGQAMEAGSHSPLGNKRCVQAPAQGRAPLHGQGRSARRPAPGRKDGPEGCEGNAEAGDSCRSAEPGQPECPPYPAQRQTACRCAPRRGTRRRQTRTCSACGTERAPQCEERGPKGSCFAPYCTSCRQVSKGVVTNLAAQAPPDAPQSFLRCASSLVSDLLAAGGQKAALTGMAGCFSPSQSPRPWTSPRRRNSTKGSWSSTAPTPYSKSPKAPPAVLPPSLACTLQCRSPPQSPSMRGTSCPCSTQRWPLGSRMQLLEVAALLHGLVAKPSKQLLSPLPPSTPA